MSPAFNKKIILFLVRKNKHFHFFASQRIQDHCGNVSKCLLAGTIISLEIDADRFYYE